MQRMRTGVVFYGLVVLAGFITFVLHEGGHWLTTILLGHEAFFGLNSSGPRGAVSASDHAIISAAGPAVTVVQAVVALWLVQAKASRTAWIFLFWPAFMRLMAMGISLFNPNDEARISDWLGWGLWTLPALVSLSLVTLLVIGSRRMRVSWKTLALTWVAASVAVSAIVGLDMVLKG